MISPFFYIFLRLCAYAFTELVSTLALLYAGQSSLLLQDEKLIATKNEATATTKNAFFIIKPIIL